MMEQLVPKLRFPEFRDDWKLKSLKEIGEIIGGGTPSTAIEEYWNGEINWFTPSEITSKYISSSKRKISELGVNKSSAKLLPVGSILLTTRATIGEVSICLEESTTNQGFQSIVVNNFNNNEFVYYLVNTLKNEFIKNSSGSTFLEISKKKIEVIKNYFPTLQEQTKIADFLGSVDKQLDILNQKKEKLNTYKKGVMQQLFAQQLRFKDDNGNDFPEWEEKTLGEVFKIQAGKDYKHLTSGNIPVYGTGGIMLYVNDYLFNGISVCIGRKGTIDKPMLLNGKFWTVDTLFYTKDFKDCIPEFIYQLFLNINWRSYNEASGVPSLSTKIINSIEIKLPSLAEQKKIADFLSAIDKQIETVSAQIQKIENYKKGLLQQMFV